jgi:hypothetical protein
VRRNNILIKIQQDATLHSLFYPETAQHVSGGATTHHQQRKQLYLQHLVFVTPLLLSAAVTNHVEQFPDKINCVTLHLFGYISQYRRVLCFCNKVSDYNSDELQHVTRCCITLSCCLFTFYLCYCS